MSEVNTDLMNGVSQTLYDETQKKKQTKKKEYNFDQLNMYFREDYYVKDIRIVQPTIGDILHIGESKFYSDLAPFLYNSTSIRVMLWELPQRIDWCNVKDIEVFNLLKGMLNNGFQTFRLLFPDYKIENMQLMQLQESDSETSSLYLYDMESGFTLSELEYMEIAEYIRTLLNIHPKIEKGKGKATKQAMIDEDKLNAIQRDNKNESTLLPLVSACINHPGFKYKLQELRDVGIYEFMDSVQRLQIYESTRALTNGMYSGMCDLSNVSKEQFNFMRNIS